MCVYLGASSGSYADGKSHSLSQANVKKKLDQFSQECRDGKREASVISTQTSATLSMNDKQLWRTIRKELEDIGITVAAFDANKDFIFEWFTNAIANGAFEERTLDDPPTAELCEESSDEGSKGNFNDITSQLGSQ
jgi:hypothetical protein